MVGNLLSNFKAVLGLFIPVRTTQTVSIIASNCTTTNAGDCLLVNLIAEVYDLDIVYEPINTFGHYFLRSCL